MINKVLNTRLSITLDKEILKKLERIAKDGCRNKSKMIEWLVKNYEEKQ